MKYFEEAQHIWETYVPTHGQAATVQGELLRAVEKLRDEATRNGNGNWDAGFEMLIAFLARHLTDLSVYEPEVLIRTKWVLARLRDDESPYLEDDLYDELGDRVVEYFRHYGSQPHAPDPRLER